MWCQPRAGSAQSHPTNSSCCCCCLADPCLAVPAPSSAGRAALHPQQHHWGWLKEWKMLVINSQPGRIWERALNPSPIRNPTGGGMPGSLCSLGLNVNIQPLTSWFESHSDIIHKICYCVNEKTLPGPFQLAPAGRALLQGCAGLCPPSQGTRPHCQVGSGKAQLRSS